MIITNQSLDREVTQALVRAMESYVGLVQLEGDVTLEIETLTRYNGQGKCDRVTCLDETYTSD